jgi:hypothetical protein
MSLITFLPQGHPLILSFLKILQLPNEKVKGKEFLKRSYASKEYLLFKTFFTYFNASWSN